MTAGVHSLRESARRLRNALRSRAIILLYHRIAALPRDPQLLTVTPAHFAEHLEVIASAGRPTALRDLPRGLRGTPARRPSIVVTFDDGYADSLTEARPLLARRGIPATVFVASGPLESRREFWQDDLERALLQPVRLPSTLQVAANGRRWQWALGADTIYPDARQREHCTWNIESRETPTVRHAIYRTLFRELVTAPTDARLAALDQLLSWAQLPVTARPTHRTLAEDELVRLADGDLIEVGAHTVNHPVLSTLPAAAQFDEIARSKRHLEDVLGHAVTSFAYPYGTRADYTPASVAAVRQAGFERACANVSGVVRGRTDCWQLPRLLVRDWSGDELARRLREWLD